MDFVETNAGVTTCACSTHARLVVAHPLCRWELLRFGNRSNQARNGRYRAAQSCAGVAGCGRSPTGPCDAERILPAQPIRLHISAQWLRNAAAAAAT